MEVKCPKCNRVMDLKPLKGGLIQTSCECGYKKVR